MMARCTPSRWKVSMSLDNSPSESQCTAAAPCFSISGEGFFLDGRDNHVKALGAGGVQHQQGEGPVARDKANPFRP